MTCNLRCSIATSDAPMHHPQEFYRAQNATIFTTSFSPRSARSSAIAANLHYIFAALYAETPRNFGNLHYDVSTVEYIPISTIRASGSSARLQPNSKCSLWQTIEFSTCDRATQVVGQGYTRLTFSREKRDFPCPVYMQYATPLAATNAQAASIAKHTHLNMRDFGRIAPRNNKRYPRYARTIHGHKYVGPSHP